MTNLFNVAVFLNKMKGPGSNDKHKIASGPFLAMRDAFLKCVFRALLWNWKARKLVFGGVSGV